MRTSAIGELDDYATTQPLRIKYLGGSLRFHDLIVLERCLIRLCAVNHYKLKITLKLSD